MIGHHAQIRRAARTAAAVGAVVLVATVATVIVNHSTSADARIVRLVARHRSGALVTGARVATTGGVLWLLLVLAALFAFWFRRRVGWRVAMVPVLALVSGSVVSEVLKRLFDRPRPPLGLRAAAAAGRAFPSGHATNAAAFFTAIAIVLLVSVVRAPLRRAVLVGVAAIAVLLVGATRVVLAVHWPSDVLAGWALGILVASASSAVSRWGTPRAAPVAPDGLESPVAERLDQSP